MSLTAQETNTYASVYELLDDMYGAEAGSSPGAHFLPQFLDAIGDRRGSALDAGCGAGQGMLALAAAGFEVMGCDLHDGRIAEAAQFPFAIANLWKPLRPQLRRGRFDWVCCSDVLEHLPTQMVGLAIDNLIRIADSGVWITVALIDDLMGPRLLGRSLHQTVRPFVWWRDTISELGVLREARDCHMNALFLVEPPR